MRITTALIDVDGTLVASNDAHARAWRDALLEAGYDVPPERLRPMIGMGGDKILPKIDGRLRDDTEPGKTIALRRGIIFKQRYLPTLQATPGSRELFERLRGEAITIVIASSASNDELQDLLNVARVADLVDLATTSDDVGESKPAPDIVEVALRKARAPAPEAIMIGDTPYDVEAARRASVAIVGVRCGGWDDDSLAGAMAVFADPADVCAHLSELLRQA